MKILFILGAGASKDANYPLGNELKGQILSSLQLNCTLPETLIKAGNTEAQIKDFEHKLRHAEFRTVDQFFEARFTTDHIRKIGREALAGTLSFREHHPFLFNGSPHWYFRLLDFLWNKPARISSDSVSFITFNYDRSLKHYLYEAITSRTDEFTERLKSDFLHGRNFFHVHGHIGFLPWQDYPNDPPHIVRPYGEPMTADHLLNTSRSLLFPHEPFTVGNIVREHVAKADVIVFLGFGFHRQNLIRIHFDEMLSSKARIYATAHKLDQQTRVELQSPKLTFVDADANAFVQELLKRVESDSLGDWDAHS